MLPGHSLPKRHRLRLFVRPPHCFPVLAARTFLLRPCPAPQASSNTRHKTYGMWISSSPSPQTRKIVVFCILMTNKSSHYYHNKWVRWKARVRLMHYILSSTAAPALAHSCLKWGALNTDSGIAVPRNLEVKMANLSLVLKVVEGFKNS